MSGNLTLFRRNRTSRWDDGELWCSISTLGHFISKPDNCVIEQGKDPEWLWEETSWIQIWIQVIKQSVTEKHLYLEKMLPLFLHQRIHSGEKATWRTGRLLAVCALNLAQQGRVPTEQTARTPMMAFAVLLTEKKLLITNYGAAKLILMWDFIPKGIVGILQRGYYRYYSKYFNMKIMWSSAFLWCWRLCAFQLWLFFTRILTRAAKRKYHRRRHTLHLDHDMGRKHPQSFS